MSSDLIQAELGDLYQRAQFIYRADPELLIGPYADLPPPTDRTVRVLLETVVYQLEAENARLRAELAIADTDTDIVARMRFRGNDLLQIMRQGWCSRKAIEDGVLAEDAVKGMGWTHDANTGCWHAAGLVLDQETFEYRRPVTEQQVAQGAAFPARALTRQIPWLRGLREDGAPR